MQQTLDMTKGSAWKSIIIFALPIFFSNLFQQLYNSADSIIVGHFINSNAYTAVSSSGNLIFLFTSFFIGTATGAGVLISKYFGAKDYESMRKAIHTDIAFGLAAGIILTILGYFISPFLLKIMKTDVEVLPESIKYFRTYFLGSIGVVMYNIFNGILNALGNSRRSLYYLIFSSLLNIGLDLLFICVFHGGVESAALATAISQLLSAFLCLLFLLKKDTIYQVKIKEVKFDKKMLKLIIKYGVPSGIQNSVIALANVFVQTNINSFGKEAMGGFGTYAKVEGFAFLPVNCFTMALTTFIGQNLGAKEYERAKKGSRFGILCSICLAEVVGITMFCFMPYIAKLFTKDQDIILFSTKQARTICLFYFLLAFSHCIAAICRGAGKAIIPMIIMLSVWCVFRVLYISVTLKIKYDIRVVYLAYPITWTISSAIYFVYYMFCDWVHGFKEKCEKNELA